MNGVTNTERRKFVKLSALGAMAVLTGSAKLNEGVYPMKVTTPVKPSDTKEIFRQCGACSHTFYHILNREFNCLRDAEEKASDPLAGGMMLGHQCGMLWGSSLAVGAESFRRYGYGNKAMNVAVNTTGQLMDSYKSMATSVNCREVTGCDLSRKSGMAKLLVKILLHGGMSNSICFRLADNWAPEAIETAKKGLKSESNEGEGQLNNCASQLIRLMGGTEEEIITVSGFSGGMGLKGYACGALGAAMWMNTLTWCRKHPGQTPPKYNKENTSRILEAFNNVADSRKTCSELTGRNFLNTEEHSAFIKSGGCSQIIKTLASAAI